MTDFALQFFPDGSADIALFNGDIIADDSLRPAVAASLLSDREWADAPSGDRRGWWGDGLVPSADRIGSGLWRLARRKADPSVPPEGTQYSKQGLAWMVEDGVAFEVTVTSRLDARGLLEQDIELHRPQGVQRFRLAALWQKSTGTSAVAEADAMAGEVSALAGAFEYIYYVQYPELD